jgi:hypothetical protein
VSTTDIPVLHSTEAAHLYPQVVLPICHMVMNLIHLWWSGVWRIKIVSSYTHPWCHRVDEGPHRLNTVEGEDKLLAVDQDRTVSHSSNVSFHADSTGVMDGLINDLDQVIGYPFGA